MSKMDSFLNRSPLKTSVSRNVISFSDISSVNMIVGWNLLACLKSLLGHEMLHSFGHHVVVMLEVVE